MMRTLLQWFLAWIKRISADTSENGRLLTALGMLASIMGLFFVALVTVMLMALGLSHAAALFCILGVWISFVTVLFARRTISFKTSFYWNNGGLVVINLAATLALGGFNSSAGLVLWSLMPALMSTVTVSLRETFAWILVFFGAVAVSLWLPPWLPPATPLPEAAIPWMYMFNIGGLTIFVLTLLQFFVIQRNLYLTRSDNLLLNILPGEIADILRNEQRVIADAFDGASILFADVVGFTPLSQTLSPAELVDLLNEVFSQFDALMDKYQLEKIKTIGDCYMAASGIPRPRPDHAQALTRMGLEIVHYVQNHEFNVTVVQSDAIR